MRARPARAVSGAPRQRSTMRARRRPWGIISLKAQSVDYELPMQPITMMRNALGAEEGGSGVGLDRDAYRKSVDFWSKYAPIK